MDACMHVCMYVMQLTYVYMNVRIYIHISLEALTSKASIELL